MNDGQTAPRRALLVTLFLVAVAALAGTTGRITGTVKDATGSPVAGAQLTITNPATGVALKSKTDKKGTFGFPTLAAGRYNLEAEAAGFKPQTRPSLIVHVDTAMQVDLVLEPEEVKK
jgi:hypothetical protein